MILDLKFDAVNWLILDCFCHFWTFLKLSSLKVLILFLNLQLPGTIFRILLMCICFAYISLATETMMLAQTCLILIRFSFNFLLTPDFLSAGCARIIEVGDNINLLISFQFWRISEFINILLPYQNWRNIQTHSLFGTLSLRILSNVLIPKIFYSQSGLATFSPSIQKSIHSLYQKFYSSISIFNYQQASMPFHLQYHALNILSLHHLQNIYRLFQIIFVRILWPISS